MYQYVFITESNIFDIKHYNLRPLNLHMDQNDEAKSTKKSKNVFVHYYTYYIRISIELSAGYDRAYTCKRVDQYPNNINIFWSWRNNEF